MSFKLTFLGDISLNGRYISFADENINPFNQLNIEQRDYTIGNLECLVEGVSENKFKKPRLKTTKRTYKFLKELNIDLISLANNHVYDNLEDGLKNTIKELNSLDISYIGADTDISTYTNTKIIEKDNIKIAIVTYMTSDTNPKIPKNANILYSLFENENDKQEEIIKKLKKEVDFVVYYMHWGGDVENRYMPSYTQTLLGKQLIDFGVDLIVGHHSHTLQPYEIYKDKYIFYSLGNFCFDDIHFEGKVYKLKDYESAILNIEFIKDNYNINLIPLLNTDERFLIKECCFSYFIRIIQLLFNKFNNKIFLYSYHMVYKYKMAIKNVIFNKEKTIKERLKYFQIKKIIKFIKKK